MGNEVKELEDRLDIMKRSRNSFKKKWEKEKRKLDKIKPYASTMARHNDRLRNENRALSSVLEEFREKLHSLCKHEPEYLKYSYTIQGKNHFNCGYCYQIVSEDELASENGLGRPLTRDEYEEIINEGRFK